MKGCIKWGLKGPELFEPHSWGVFMEASSSRRDALTQLQPLFPPWRMGVRLKLPSSASWLGLSGALPPAQKIIQKPTKGHLIRIQGLIHRGNSEGFRSCVRNRAKDQLFQRKMLLVPLSCKKWQGTRSFVPGTRGRDQPSEQKRFLLVFIT